MTEERRPGALIAVALRRERRRTGMSLSDLARRAGVGKSTLSQLEAGAGNPSLDTLWALAVALDIPASRLLDPPAGSLVHLVRAGAGPSLATSNGGYRAALLTTCPPGARRDVYRITAEPGPGRASEPHGVGVVEHVVLAGGRAEVGPDGGAVVLEPGDCLSYPGDLPHVFKALLPGTSAVLVSEHT